VKEHLWTALSSLASAPIGERTITGLAVLLQSTDLKQALRPYCLGGLYGRLLDAEIEDLGETSVQAFEIEGLVGTGAAPVVLSYLFHRIRDRLDGQPTLLIIDEGWLALDDEGFAGQLREWPKTLRKKNASVIFATQSQSDIDGSAISRLPDVEGDKPQRQKFKRYPIGYFYINIAEVQTAEGKQFLFVGIDRTPGSMGTRVTSISTVRVRICPAKPDLLRVNSPIWGMGGVFSLAVEGGDEARTSKADKADDVGQADVRRQPI
jgi:hypothetical protein